MILKELFGLESAVPLMIDYIISKAKRSTHTEEVEKILKSIGLSPDSSEKEMKSVLRELGYSDERKLLRKFNDIRELDGKSRIKPSVISSQGFPKEEE